MRSRHPPYLSVHHAGLYDSFRCESSPFAIPLTPLWIAGKLELDVSVAFLEKQTGNPLDDFVHEVEKVMGRGLEGRMALTIAEVDMDINPLARREKSDVTRRLKEFCKMVKPVMLDLDSNLPSWIERGADLPLPSVVEVRISMDKTTDTLCKTIPVLFRAFPNLRSVTTWWTRLGDAWEPLQLALPLNLRSQLSKIDVALKEGKEQESLNLLRMPAVFPSVKDFGTFSIFDNLWDRCGNTGIDLATLSNITTLRVQGRSHDVPIVTSVSSLRCIADGFAQYMPLLRTLTLCFFLSSNEELGVGLEYVAGLESEDMTDLLIGWSYLVRTVPAITIIFELIEPPSPRPETRQGFLEELRHILYNVGFMYLVDSGISDQLVDEVKSFTIKFFELPEDAKMKIEMANSPTFLGYNRRDYEVTKSKIDHREQFDIAADTPCFYVPGVTPEYYRLRGPAQWPEEQAIPGFRKTMLEYIQKLTELVFEFTSCVEEALHLRSGTLDRVFGDWRNHVDQGGFMKLIRYEAVPADADPTDNQGVGPHKDGWVTFLLQVNDVWGLQVQNHEGDWIDVPEQHGSFVVNFLERMLHGAVIATTHRVLLGPPGSPARYSVPFFQQLKLEASIAPIPLEDLPEDMKELARRRVQSDGMKNM
ncbi:hypothetical protein HDU93_007959 [Gonapodya sp. JEL0774]|nr:hypothetical protein HDU93_007959 [Gonapodya sp. JEL0774]